MQLCLSDWKNVFVFLWNIFLCQAVGNWRNVDQTEFVFCRFGYVFQLGESWRKIAGGHFGSRFRLCCGTFFDFPPFCYWAHPVGTWRSGIFILFSCVTDFYFQWHRLWSDLQRWHLRTRFLLHWCRCWNSSRTWPYHRCSFRCCWTAGLSFQTPIRADLDWGLTLSRPSNGHIILWTGALPMQNLLHVHKSKNLCCAPSASLLLVFLHCSSLRYWNLETAPVHPGQDTIATLAQSLTNCQDNTRVLPCCTTSSPTSSKTSFEQTETEDFNSHQICDACGGVSP